MDQKKWKSKLAQATAFIVLMGITFYFLLREQDLRSIWKVVTEADPIWIWISLISMGVYIFCGGFCIRVLMNGRGSRVTIPQCFEYSVLEVFFSAITPSSTGGQPLQLRAMTKDGHPMADSTGALIAITLLYKCAFLCLTALFFLIEIRYVSTAISGVRFLAVLGLIMNLGLMTFLLIALFSKSLTNRAIRFLVRVLGKLHFVKNVPELMDRVQDKLEQYHECSQFFKENPKQVVKTFGILVIQRLSIMIVPYLVYKSFGLSGHGLIHILATQVIVNLCCDMLPLPGAVGISEALFLSLFGPIFTERKLYAAVLLSRGITYYLLMIASGILILAFKGVRAVKNRRLLRN